MDCKLVKLKKKLIKLIKLFLKLPLMHGVAMGRGG
jgi:hypothetical protein